MNREIKFRVYDKLSKRMAMVTKMEFMPFPEMWIWDDGHSNGSSPHVYHLMQYTGLKDKNGKDIYECDEMSGEDAYGEKIKGVVKFIDGAFLLISHNHFFTQVGHSNHSHTYFRDMAGQLEICGLVIADLKVAEE